MNRRFEVPQESPVDHINQFLGEMDAALSKSEQRHNKLEEEFQNVLIRMNLLFPSLNFPEAKTEIEKIKHSAKEIELSINELTQHVTERKKEINLLKLSLGASDETVKKCFVEEGLLEKTNNSFIELQQEVDILGKNTEQMLGNFSNSITGLEGFVQLLSSAKSPESLEKIKNSLGKQRSQNN